MLAVLGGSIAALCWAAASLAASRAARVAGPRVVLAWVMLVGFVIAVPVAVVEGVPPLDAEAWVLLLVAGLGNVLGLSLAYAAFATGKLSVAAPIVSTEGALAAVIAVVLGEPLALPVAIALGVIAVGVVLASREPQRTAATPPDAPDVLPVASAEPALVPDAAALAAAHASDRTRSPSATDGDDARRSALLAVAAAISFSFGLYATGRIGDELGPGLTVLPSRLAGVLLVALPIVLAGRLAIPRSIAPLVVLVGTLEVVGVIAIAVGATDAISVTAVVSSQFAGIAAIAAFVLFRERLARGQVIGIVAIALGVAAVALLRAG